MMDPPVGGMGMDGSGTAEDPYVIRDLWDLQKMRDDLTAYYVLGNDIDASDTYNWYGGKGFLPVGNYENRFRGDLDGKSHVIQELFINRSDMNDVGLFGYVVTAGSIRNVKMLMANITGNDRVGALAGELSYLMRVSNCHVSGEIYGNRYVGGLIGYIDRATVSDCSSRAEVRGVSYVGGLVGYLWFGKVHSSCAKGLANSTDLFSRVGGMVGYNKNGTIYNCYSTATAQGIYRVGGLLGFNNYGTVSRSFAAGRTEGVDWHVGGLIGTCYEGVTTDSFWDCNSTGHGNSSGGVARTTELMWQRSTFLDAGWDLDGIWCLVDNVSYPFFRWEDTEDPVADAGPDQTIEVGRYAFFNGRGSHDDTFVVDHTWRFEDKGPVVLYGVEAFHRFMDIGRYVVRLDVWDPLGKHGTDEMSVEVGDFTDPYADAGKDLYVDEGTVVILDGSNSRDNYGIANFTWSFIDGYAIILHGATNTYRFDDPGQYRVTLKVTDLSGNWAVDTVMVTVLDTTPPTPIAGPDLVVRGDTAIVFDGSDSFDNVGITGYTWSFHDGIEHVVLHGPTPAHIFVVPGTYTVTLTVTDEVYNRMSDTITVTVLDHIPPVAYLGEDRTVPAGREVVLNGSLSSDNIGIEKYRWSLVYDEEEMIFLEEEFRFTFDVGGVYRVSLYVFDAEMNHDETILTLTVVDTGVVRGTVADADSKRIGGVDVDIVASDGKRYSTRTRADGNFSIEVHYGPFEWRISKKGYRSIEGSSYLNAMEDEYLDLADPPLIWIGDDGPKNPLPYILSSFFLIVLIISISAGSVMFFILKRPKGKREDAVPEVDEKIHEDSDHTKTGYIPSLYKEEGVWTKDPYTGSYPEYRSFNHEDPAEDLIECQW